MKQIPREIIEVAVAFGAFQVYEGEHIWNFLFRNPIPENDTWALHSEPKIYNIVAEKDFLEEHDFLNLWTTFTYGFCSDKWCGEQARKTEAIKAIVVLGGTEWLMHGGIEISAHERLEWQLEYEEQLKALNVR